MRRQKQLDILKGIGAILVVLGHIVEVDSNVKVYLYSFHMPLFFFVSGYFIHYEKNMINFVKKKIKRLIIPYFIFAAISAIISIGLMNMVMTKKEILENYFFIKGYIIWNTSLWFLITMFFSVIIFQCYLHLKERFKIHRIIEIILFGILLIGINILLVKYQVKLLFGLEIVPHAILIIYFGYICHQYQSKINNIWQKIQMKTNILARGGLLIIIGILGYFLAIKNGRVNMSSCQFQNYFLYLLVVCMNILVYTVIAKTIQHSKILEKISDMSLYMFCTQKLLFQLFYFIQNRLGIIFMNSTHVGINIVITIITICLYYISWNKTKRILKFLN